MTIPVPHDNRISERELEAKPASRRPADDPLMGIVAGQGRVGRLLCCMEIMYA